MGVVVAGVALEFERGVHDPELRREHLFQLVPALLSLMQRDLACQHDVCRQGRHVGRKAPQVKVVNGLDAVFGEQGCFDIGSVHSRWSAFEQHVGGVGEEPEAE